MRAFQYESPARFEDALALIRDGDRARPLAGGTDLLTLVKADVVQPERLVNLKALPGMAGIDFDPAHGLRVGGLTTLAELELNEDVRSHYPALREALEVAATPQLRNMATVAGNLLQRPRCWYFRNAHVDCWLKGGASCPMREGENRFAAVFEQSSCWAVHPSDLAPVLVMLDAEVRVRGSAGERTLPIAELLQPPSDTRRTETVLGTNELIVSLRLPAPPAGLRMTYRKAMNRKIWAFALCGAAAALLLDGERVAQARIVLSGVANVPLRATSVEQVLVGARLDGERIARAAEAAVDGATPLRDNGYKLPLTRALVRQALDVLAG